MIHWVVFAEQPCGTVSAPDADLAAKEARRSFGWTIWGLEALGNGHWNCLQRQVIGEVEGPDKGAALARAYAKYGAQVVAVQSVASYAISTDTEEAITGRMHVRYKHARQKE
jgi:hypothetical protein